MGVSKAHYHFKCGQKKFSKTWNNYDIARGVYLKTIQDDVVRILRHSDDFRISASQIRRCRATTMTDDYDRGSKCGHIVG